ncbi:sugar phosphate nucleotidyltransferase [Halalkalibacter urbisdiaboli]|uniref:sugar phosphate nucleotidyltransferase n=1 Tax=Halalkalibacter urbisdiaboli TaxID=1960589 RepID=UPI000B436FDF|nr:sugar phosphate nucleotidyltransferase [Halalkalibacter urbisdiaboli]
MKGVIMAGGKGTRLRPLTCQLPKPMVPLVQKPVMEYSIELLKKYGITDIAVTVQYLPDAIRDYFGDGQEFGVNLHYFEEETPLGTAGSVKQAQDFLDEPFVVVSGDALTDFDLSKGIAFHEQKNSVVTIFMKKVPCPLEFGVIMTNEQDEIVRFLEKPSWSEVFSDTVNTGIYIMDPSVFSFIDENKVTDFSKDVFPKLLESRSGLFGYAAEGYWSDIGNLSQYRQAQIDILNRDVQVAIAGEEIEPGIWVGKDVVIEDGVKLEAPLSIGNQTIVRKDAVLGAHTVLGNDSTVSNRASTKRTIIWDGVYVGDDSELRGSTVCQGVTFGMKSVVYEEAVIGHHCIIGEEAKIQPGIKLWPHKTIKSETTIHQSIVWNDSNSAQPVLQGHQAVGVANIEMTPEQVAKLGAAFGSLLKREDTVYVGGDKHPYTQLLKTTLVQSLQATGVNIIDVGETMLPVLRYALEKHQVQGGIFVRMSNRKQQQQAIVEFFEGNGLPISSNIQRELEQKVVFQNYRRVAFDYVGSFEKNETVEFIYKNELIRSINESRIRARSFKISVLDERSEDHQLLFSVLSDLNCEVENVYSHMEVEQFRQLIQCQGADFGVIIGESGEFMSLVSEEGDIVSEEEQLALFVSMQLCNGNKQQIAIPLHGGNALEEIAAGYEIELIRTKGTARAMMEVERSVQLYLYDTVFALTHLLHDLSKGQVTLSERLHVLPTDVMYKESVSCHTEQKGTVMRKLMESFIGKEVELNDGMKIRHQEGSWTFIVPNQDEPTFTIYAQAGEELLAKELADEYIEKINQYKQL